MTRICDGLNVIEYGAGSVAASIAGMVLADAGARVIKIEPPDGDRLRRDNPSGFLVWNRGKESLVADLRTGEGQQALRDLAAGADVAIEGFAPGVTAEWGIGADVLQQLNPRLVHLGITAFGTSGPYANIKAYDPLVAAKVGVWARGTFGHRDGPQMYPVPWASFGAAMQGVAGVMGALNARERTGRGQSVAATLFAGIDPIEYFVLNIVQLMAKRGETPSGDARSAMAASRYSMLFVSKDSRFIQTSTLLLHQAKALCEVAGVEHILDEPRFLRAPMFDNADDAQAFEDILLEAFRSEDLSHWLPKLQANRDVAFEVAVTSEEALDHPQIVYNGDAITLDDTGVGPIREVGPLFHSTETPMEPIRSAPVLGDNAGPFAASDASPATGEATRYPFEGVTVVEFGYFYAMPYGVTMLASLGARVIKIEDGKGDPHRMSFGPEVASTKTTAGKESVSLDLSTEAGRKVAQQIVANADVFVTGFRTGIPEKLGLGYEEMKTLNPRLVYVHAAGYGTTGPYAQRALYAQAASAAAGSFGRQVGYWTNPEVSLDMSVMELQVVVLPRLSQVVDGDSNSAICLFPSLAMAIYHQQRTGQGQFLSTSMIASNAWGYSDDFCTYAGKPPVALCDDDYMGIHALERVYPAAGGSWVQLAVRTDHELGSLMDAIGRRELLDDPRFSDAAARAANDSALVKELSAVFASRPAAEWEADLSAVDVGCVSCDLKGQPVFTSFDPGLREAGLTRTYEHPVYGEMVRPAPPLTFSESSTRFEPPCLRGQHNHKVLTELGYSESEIADLEASGAVIAQATA
jgi:crotonobetainyl-CoA:carnitine CoA-transferase CaiB-like acyl-CoA transferase